MGLVEAHGDGFKDALKDEFGATQCKDSTCNQKKECFLVSQDEEWRVGDTECDRFNVAIKELLHELADTGTEFADKSLPAQRLQNLKCAVAGRREDDPVVYVVAYANSGLETKEQMSFLTEINAQLEAAFGDLTNLPVVLMGDWNTTTPEAISGVTQNMELNYQEHGIFRPTTKKKRTLCQAQTHKSLTNDTGTKDYIFLSKHITGTLLLHYPLELYYVSNRSTFTKLVADSISFLPSREHFSDHVAVVQHWESDAKTHRVATLNCMSEPYNSLAFYDEDRTSLSNKVNAALEAKVFISKTLFLQHIDTLLSCNVDEDVKTHLRQKKKHVQAHKYASLPFWYIFIPYHRWSECNYLAQLKNLKDARNLVKQYSFAMDYRPDLVNFQHYKEAGIAEIKTAQKALQVFQDCVDADDSTFDTNVETWVTKMCFHINNYKKKEWSEDGTYQNNNEYTVNRAKHIATCLLIGLWMIDSLRHRALRF